MFLLVIVMLLTLLHPPKAEVIKVFDGNSSLRRRMFRIVSVPRSACTNELLTAALRAFHIPR